MFAFLLKLYAGRSYEIGETDCRSAADIWLAAIHEAGHVVAASKYLGGVEMVTLSGLAGTGGCAR